MSKEFSEDSVSIGRRQLLLLMLALNPDGSLADGLRGITRLQKYMFLLEQEYDVVLKGDNAFAFKAYKAGPYSRKIYDDLELLENLGLVKSETTGNATAKEIEVIEDLTFDHLIGGDSTALSSESAELAETSDSFDERHFSLTEQGVKQIETLLKKDDSEVFTSGIRKVKSRFANHSLQDLLHYVYTKYEEAGWINESEIRDQVLTRGSRKK